MKRLSVVFIFMFLAKNIYSESNVSFSYHIGDNIFFNKDLEFAFQEFSVNINKSNIFLEAGFLMPLARTTDNKSHTEWESNVGFSSSFGYQFLKSYNDKRFSFAPCLSSNLFNFKENKYTQYDVFQSGIKIKFSGYIPVNKFSIGITFAPQFNFFNLINSSSEKKITYYLREKDNDGNYKKNDNNEYIYYSETISVIESKKRNNFHQFSV